MRHKSTLVDPGKVKMSVLSSGTFNFKTLPNLTLHNKSQHHIPKPTDSSSDLSQTADTLPQALTQTLDSGLLISKIKFLYPRKWVTKIVQNCMINNLVSVQICIKCLFRNWEMVLKGNLIIPGSGDKMSSTDSSTLSLRRSPTDLVHLLEDEFATRRSAESHFWTILNANFCE